MWMKHQVNFCGDIDSRLQLWKGWSWGDVGSDAGKLSAFPNRAANTQADGCCQSCESNGEAMAVKHYYIGQSRLRILDWDRYVLVEDWSLKSWLSLCFTIKVERLIYFLAAWIPAILNVNTTSYLVWSHWESKKVMFTPDWWDLSLQHLSYYHLNWFPHLPVMSNGCVEGGRIYFLTVYWFWPLMDTENGC